MPIIGLLILVFVFLAIFAVPSRTTPTVRNNPAPPRMEATNAPTRRRLRPNEYGEIE